MKEARKKKAIALGSAGVITLALLAGSVTTANWSDAVGLSGAEITAGNLDIEKIGNTIWSERSLDSTNFGNEIVLSDYRITPGDTIQGRQDLDVALEGKNLRATFSVNTPQLSGDLYSGANGVSGNFMVIDENGFVVIPTTPLADVSPETILIPDNVTAAVDNIKDYTFIVTVSFDENTPEQIRTQAQADLSEMSFHLNQLRDGSLMQPLPENTYEYTLNAQTSPSDAVISPGGTVRFGHTLRNTGSAPITDIEIRSPYGTSSVVSSLEPGQAVTFFMDVENVSSSIEPTFEFFGVADAGLTKLGETTTQVEVVDYSVNVLRTSSSTTDPQTDNTSAIVTHEITNTSTVPLNNIVVSAPGLANSNISGTVNPGEKVILYTNIPSANWSGGKVFEFSVFGDANNSQNILLSKSSSNIVGVPVQSSEINTVALGLSHTCDIRNGGQVWCWGSDGYGQLGNGSAGSSAVAVRAGNIDNAVSIEAGTHQNYVLTESGELWSWGRTDWGGLGLGTNSNQPDPVRVNVPPVKRVASTHAWSHSVIELMDGTVMVTGGGTYSGADSSQVYVEPKKPFNNPIDISAGNKNTYIIAEDGTVWGAGNPSHSSLNGGSVINKWTQIGTHSDAVELYDGVEFGAAYRRANGEIWGWGDDSEGQFGLGDTSSGRPLTRLPHYEGAAQLVFGGKHAMMLKADGTVWTNGSNANGQLGLGDTVRRTEPTQVPGLTGVTSLWASWQGSSALTPSGRYAWGQNNSKELGVANNSSKVLSPELVVQ